MPSTQIEAQLHQHVMEAMSEQQSIISDLCRLEQDIFPLLEHEQNENESHTNNIKGTHDFLSSIMEQLQHSFNSNPYAQNWETEAGGGAGEEDTMGDEEDAAPHQMGADDMEVELQDTGHA